jgi:hypothetical protein
MGLGVSWVLVVWLKFGSLCGREMQRPPLPQRIWVFAPVRKTGVVPTRSFLPPARYFRFFVNHFSPGGIYTIEYMVAALVGLPLIEKEP